MKKGGSIRLRYGRIYMHVQFQNSAMSILTMNDVPTISMLIKCGEGRGGVLLTVSQAQVSKAHVKVPLKMIKIF